MTCKHRATESSYSGVGTCEAISPSVSDSRLRRTAPRLARENQVREAFNSPFWPFVLATTSVGQEGLDFHPYCHSITHWNLPSNPVDLEQREGRIHRYKGHAVRKNVASTYISSLAEASGGDPWQALFQAGNQEHRSSSRGLVPYWIFSKDNGATVHRCLSSLPLSREQHHFQALKNSLAVYRMVFGQARQEDLIEYLLQHLPQERVDALARQLRMDLAPPFFGGDTQLRYRD